ncbi:MAG: FAD-dependent oxidoreductase, partial [Anaerolineales bacterium]|nr:FAD-dependent oxidoreductase [Anaerolineales bacterium]
MSLRGGRSSRRSNLLTREEIASSLTPFAPRNDIYDVAIIGAGAVGSAIARELSKYDMNVVLLEANSDVGMGTSKASTAIWHTGYDAMPGSLESKLLKRSYPLMEAFMKEVGSPFELVGGLLIAWNEEQLHTLPKLLEKAIQNGDTDCYLIDKDEVYKREPHLGEGALGGMIVPREGILCTFTIPLACATQAVVNGVELKLGFRVKSVVSRKWKVDGGKQLSVNSEQLEDGYEISNWEEAIYSRWIINAAGLYSDDVNKMFGHEEFRVTPRRGELIVYDKLARRLVNHVLLPVPTATTKGVLVSPTIYGNVLLGPTAEDLDDKSATNTSEGGLKSLLEKGKKILPELLDEEVTATYAGLRAATEHSDYQIALHKEQRYICVGGIRSTGISGCLGIAEYVVDLLKEGGVELMRKPEFKSIKMPNIGEAFPRPYQMGEVIEGNSDYGKIVCHCERVTLGELKDAMNSPIPATSLDALRRRTRAMQGRCQGFNCQAALVKELTAKNDRDAKEKQKEFLGVLRALGGSRNVDVLIVGAGPAGLAAALELKKLGIRDVVIAERESEAGGIPRLCGHTGFGLRDFHRVMTGPSYARKYRELIEEAELELRVANSILDINTKQNKLQHKQQIEASYTSPNGNGIIEARFVLVATGVRERPRSARLIPGHRPQGVFTTGSLQRFVYEHHLPVGKSAVIVGTEIVSLSVVTTLLNAGVKVVAMVTELPSHQLYLPIFLPAKILYADVLARAKMLTNARVTNIYGKERVEGIEIGQFGKLSYIECDTVVFTGDWIPENELARRGGVETLKPSFGPQVDGEFRTSQRGVFAAGNVLRGVETADWAAMEGRAAARAIARWLENAEWSASRLNVEVEPPISWICPNVLSPDVKVDGFRIWSREFRTNATLQLKQGGRVLYKKRVGWLRANVALGLSGEWV